MRKFNTFIVAAALAASIGCAGKAAKVYVAADSAVVDVLLDFKNAKDVRCDAGEIPASSCEAIAKAFVPVWDAYLETNALLTAEAPIVEVDAAVVRYKAVATSLKDVVLEVKGEAKQLLLDLLESAIRRFDRGNN